MAKLKKSAGSGGSRSAAGIVRELFAVVSLCLFAGSCTAGARNAPSDSGPAARRPESKAEAVRLHPEFALARDGLSALLRDLPAETAESILSRPGEFLELAAGILDAPGDLVVLVDKNNPLPENHEPADLRPLSGLPLKTARAGLRLRETLIPDLVLMAEAARGDGVELLVSSAYRSYAYQKTVYDRIVRELGREAADRESARPGHSQHQLGTAIDFGSISDAFTGTPMQRWLEAHARRFGFSLSYPAGREELTGYRHESWHFRYIGRAAAKMEKEFFGGLQQIMLVFWKNHGRALAAARQKSST